MKNLNKQKGFCTIDTTDLAMAFLVALIIVVGIQVVGPINPVDFNSEQQQQSSLDHRYQKIICEPY